MEKNYENAKNYLLKLLGRQDYSLYELERKLRFKKYEPAVISKAMAYIKASGVIDHSAQAKKIIERETGSNPKGVYIIRRKLLSKGYKKEDFDEKLSGLDQMELARVQADKRMRKPFKNNPKVPPDLSPGVDHSLSGGNRRRKSPGSTDKMFIKQALSKYLATKGFPYDIIEKIVNEKIGFIDNGNME